jgi:hypothetical protein
VKGEGQNYPGSRERESLVVSRKLLYEEEYAEEQRQRASKGRQSKWRGIQRRQIVIGRGIK